MKKSVARQVKEIDIQNAICDYLAMKNYFFRRQNTSGMFREDRWFSLPKYAKNGVPDIEMVVGGEYIGIEVKKVGGKQNPNQIKYQQDLEKIGKGKYYIVYSVDDVIKLGF